MRDEQGFADFAAARGGALRRQALLLTGSAERAGRVTERALADTARRWDKLGGTVAAEEHARRVVAAAALRERSGREPSGREPSGRERSGRERSGRERSGRERSRVGTAPPPAGDDTGEVVWRALAGLPPRRRAALVLRYDEGLDDIAVGARLGIPPATATAEADAGLTALRSLLRRRGAPEDLLPAALGDPARDLPAAGPPVPAPPAAPAGGPGGGRRGSRRRWAVVAGVGVAVAAVGAAVLVPTLSDGAAVAAPDPLPATAPASGSGLDWTARGPLAGDQELLRGALRAWRDGVPAAQRPLDAAVLYAGAPDGVRVVLLQGADALGLTWLAEVTDPGGAPALRATAPLGRAAPLVALGGGGDTRLLAPEGATVLVRVADQPADAPLRSLAMDADGLSEPVTPAAGGLAAVVLRGDAVLGSGSVRPGRLSAVTGPVEIAAGTLGLGPGTDVRAVWYGDGALLARRLGGPVALAAAGPPRTSTVRVRGRARRLEARGYEVVRGGGRHLASVVRVAGAPVCVQTAEVTAGRTPVLVGRCVPTGAADGVLHAVAGDGVRSVRVALSGRGAARRPVTVTGPAGDGMSGLARMPAALGSPAPAEARTGAGTVVARFTVPAYRGPRV